jgi:hypothetical protein
MPQLFSASVGSWPAVQGCTTSDPGTSGRGRRRAQQGVTTLDRVPADGYQTTKDNRQFSVCAGCDSRAVDGSAHHRGGGRSGTARRNSGCAVALGNLEQTAPEWMLALCCGTPLLLFFLSRAMDKSRRVQAAARETQNAGCDQTAASAGSGGKPGGDLAAGGQAID